MGKFIRFGAIDVIKPYEHIKRYGRKPYACIELLLTPDTNAPRRQIAVHGTEEGCEGRAVPRATRRATAAAACRAMTGKPWTRVYPGVRT